jgi:two-component system sensor histidine kinase GlrK
MKLATRMAVCLTLLAGLLIGTSLYQLRQIERIHSIGRELSATDVEAGLVAVQLFQSIEGVREFGSKSIAVFGGDPEYLREWAAWEDSVEVNLAQLDSLSLGDAEAVQIDRLSGAWRTYQNLFPQVLRDSLASVRPGQSTSAFLPLVDSLYNVVYWLNDATDSLLAANERSITLRQTESLAAVDEARRTATIAGGGSLLLAVLLSIGLFLYTSGPLRRLILGTREIAGGNFSHRIRVSGGGELSRLAEDFNTMATKLAEVDELKKDFVSHVSHELKGPLAAIQETHLILLERIPGPLTSKQAHLLELSHQSSKRLGVMIGNLLGVSRLEAGSMHAHFEDQDVAELTADVVDELSALAEEKELDVRLEFAPSTTLSCDAERLREVVANLVGNAYKFSPRAGVVRVSWRALAEPPPKWQGARIGREGVAAPYLLLAVEDEGPGVADAHKEGIFEKFFQVRRHTRTRGGGVGLGLAIARKIVEAHGGRIWVEDGEVRGSRFQAIFPGAVLSPRTPEGPSAPADESIVSKLAAGFDLRTEHSSSSTG